MTEPTAAQERAAILALIDKNILRGGEKVESLLKEYPKNHCKPAKYAGALAMLERLRDAILDEAHHHGESK